MSNVFLKLAAAQAPTSQEDDDQDKAALWLSGGDGAAAAAQTGGKASAIAGDAPAAAAAESTSAGTGTGAGASSLATGAAAMTGSMLTSQVILGTFAVAAAANQHDSELRSNVSARDHLSIGQGGDASTTTPQPGSDTRTDAAVTTPQPGDDTHAGTAVTTPQLGDDTHAGTAITTLQPGDEPNTGDTGTDNTDATSQSGSDGHAGTTSSPDGNTSGDATAQTPTLPTYIDRPTVAYVFDESKAVGAEIFLGTKEETAPAFVRITAIHGKDGDAAVGTMSLKDGEAITVGQVIARADFERIVWDASKNEGGNFSFVPVQDAEGTALQGASEQTVTIDEAQGNFLFHLVPYYFNPMDENPAYVKVTGIEESQDTNGILDALVVVNGDEQRVLKVDDLIRAEDFDNVYWNYASNLGGSFRLTPYDADGRMVDPGPYELELEPAWKPEGKSLPVQKTGEIRDVTDLSAEADPIGLAHLTTGSTTLLDSLLAQNPGIGLV